ncbi:J domain-containing protein [Leptolyngbya sp. PCC 6406]|uniref:J domain-containing protein n=1 Tax=Leptolyngbya sp. PCC 6406 TaxID=1173264 RepID=UPI0002AD0397|nr:DnaJ domain-containing protein [Leptolyngbya sp. PCC 6406]
MSNADFSPDWIKRFATDPYAVLGLAVTADERRILKRYHQVAKQLHPDVQSGNDDAGEAFANQVLTRFVNPAYQRLKQEKGRAETLATLRFKVRRLSREEKLQARRDLAQKLMVVPESEVDTFYEQTLTQLSEIQYESAETFIQQTAAIAELNMIYLRRKMGDPVIREKRAGLVSSATIQTPVTAPPPAPFEPEPEPVNYAQRHIERAKTYIANKRYPQAIQELRDAVRIEATNAGYHTMLGQAYLLNKMEGMAKVHIRQALKLNPRHAVALKYAHQLAIDTGEYNNNGSQQKGGGLFGMFAKKR